MATCYPQLRQEMTLAELRRAFSLTQDPLARSLLSIEQQPA